MPANSSLDNVRAKALDRIERSERNYKISFIAAAAVQLMFLWGFIELAEFSNRVHVLLFLTMSATYTLVVLGLAVLGSHVSRNTRHIINAIETLAKPSGKD